jgi:internalin A
VSRDRFEKLVFQLKSEPRSDLDLSNAEVTDKGLAHLLSSADKPASIQSLNLRGNRAITDAAVVEVARHLTGLTSLNLTYCDKVTDAAVVEVARHLTGLTSLDLWGCRQVTDAAVVEVARRLTGLASLNLRVCRQVTDAAVVEVARHLTGLTSLNLRGCRQVTDAAVAEVAQRLTRLTSLGLGDCGQITDAAVAEVAEHLTCLISLDLWACDQITDTAVAEVARRLTGLTSLDLRGCDRISRLPDTIGNLTRLEMLDLGGTSLTHLPKSMTSLTGLRILRLPGNPALGLPTELLDRATDPAAILDYYFRGAREGKRRLNEAKLIVVGNEAVGKTSLVNFLIKDQPCRPGEAKTPGVNILERISVEKWTLDADPAESQSLRLNVWDFGGQEVMHRTHQFFLTERSLYLLVLEARRENTTDNDDLVHEWMRTIRNRAATAPVIVVINKSEPPHELRLDERSLMRDYPDIRGIVRTSCLDPQKKPGVGGTGIKELRGLIERIVREELPHVRDWFPTSYFQVKESLGGRAREESVLDSHEYRTLCEQNGIAKVEEQNTLLGLLDAIGVVVSYDATTLLDPNWLTTAVYRLLTHADVPKANGEFAYHDLPKLLAGLPAEKYPEGRWPFVVTMMKRFQLCFDLKDCGHDRYLIPEQLPPNEPETGFAEAGCLRFRFDYDALPHGLLPQFIVQAHDLLTDRPTVWANGAVLRTNDCKVLVRADRKRHQVHIFVAGPETRRRSALAVVRDRFAQVHKFNRALNPKEAVPLLDQPEVAADYAWLVLQEESGEKECWPPGAAHKYPVAALLNGVDEGSRRRPTREDELAARGDTYQINVETMISPVIGPKNATTVGDIDIGSPTRKPPKRARAPASAKPKPTPTQRRPRAMSKKKDAQPTTNVTTGQGPMIGVAVGDGNMIELGDVTIYEQNLKQSGNAVPPELAAALVGALRGIQESSLTEPLKKAATEDHAKLTEELKKPEVEREPKLIKRFWNGLWSVADKIPSVIKLYEALKKYVPDL